jgi:hypothetical protein
MEDKKEKIFIEVKGSTKEKFMEVRPYIRMDQLKLALKKGKNYEFHILLGFKDGKPKEHYIFSGQDLTGYKECIGDALDFRKKFREKWSKSKCSKIFSKPDIEVFLKEKIGKKADDYIKERQ